MKGRTRGNGENGAEERRRGASVMDHASASTVSRLSAYYRILGDFERERAETIPSKRLAARAAEKKGVVSCAL